jgi:hypothetical protein
MRCCALIDQVSVPHRQSILAAPAFLVLSVTVLQFAMAAETNRLASP